MFTDFSKAILHAFLTYMTSECVEENMDKLFCVRDNLYCIMIKIIIQKQQVMLIITCST